MNAVATITKRNMIYIPTRMLNSLGLDVGDKFTVTLNDKKITLIAKKEDKDPLAELRGMIKLKKGQIFDPRNMPRLGDLPYYRI